MKKHIFLLAVFATLTIAAFNVQASASTTHIVESGDTLWDIARDNHISVDDLLTWNELNTILIRPTQELKVDGKIKSYIVKKGDTLFDIAQAHNISLDELMKWNEVSSHLIYPGEELVLEGTNKSSSNAPAGSSASKAKESTPSPPVAKSPAPKSSAPQSSSPAAKEMVVTATAYTAFCTGCSGVTYTGIDLRSNPNQKVIAVDPSIIPLGSRVWVEGYGEAIAGDIGGAIKGNIIDVFLENRQDALNWGRKTVTIKILQ